MRRIITIANQKGGVGKTTTAVNLAAGLAMLGNEVAVIDLDSQAALTICFGQDPYSIRPSTYNLLTEPGLTLSDISHDVGPNLCLAPANVELIAAEYRLLKNQDRALRLKKAIDGDNVSVDFILIDTPPSLSILTVNGIVAANELLIPVAANYLSMRGVRSLLESVWLIRDKVNPDLKLLGILPTLVQADQSHAMAAIAEMQSVFKHKVFRTFIPMDEVAATAPALRKTTLDYKPNSAVAIAYKNLAKEVSNAKP